jgi:hypothetical protein
MLFMHSKTRFSMNLVVQLTRVALLATCPFFLMGIHQVPLF